MPDLTQRTFERRHRTVVVAVVTLLALAICSLPVALGVLGDGFTIRAPAGLALLLAVLAVTLLTIFDLIARYDRASVPKGDGS